MDDVDKILEERGSRYGDFTAQADIAQRFKTTMCQGLSAHKLSPEKVEALEMIFSKIARILNGDPNYQDNWDDIAGYAKLVSKTLKPEKNE